MIRRIRVILFILIALTALTVIFEMTRPYRPDNFIDDFVDSAIGRVPEFSEEEEDASPVYFTVPEGDFQEGEYIIVTEERSNYEHDGMMLIIPALSLHCPVRAGTTQGNLSRGPGLFETSGMPGQSGANVSIAGHRTRDQFLFLDRVGSGDILQISYDSHIYTYTYHNTDVVLPSDWSVISEQGFDCVTLVTCTPIGISDRRMIVRFELISVESLNDADESDDASDDYDEDADDTNGTGIHSEDIIT